MSEGIDYTRVDQDSPGDGDIFERGSRHPRWRGGVDKETRRRRQRSYRLYGIGISTLSNSTQAKNTTKLISNPLVDFRTGRKRNIKVSGITTTDEAESLIVQILGQSNNVSISELISTGSALIFIEKIQYKVSLLSNEGYELTITRTGRVKQIPYQKSLLQVVRDYRKQKRKRRMRLRQTQSQKHTNAIRGLDRIKINEQ